MKKSFAALFFALHLLPALQVWAPRIAPLCAACETMSHENCAAEGHDCAHAMNVSAKPSCHASPEMPKQELAVKQDSCCDDGTGSDRAEEKSTEQTIGHKCPAAAFHLIVNSDNRLPCPSSGSIARPNLVASTHFPISTRRTYISDSGIDRPPPPTV